VRGYIVATIATQIAVLPLLIYQIGQVSLVSVPVNVLVLPVVPVAMLGAFLSAVASYIFVPLGLAVGFITQLSLTYIISIAEWFSRLPFAVVEFSAVSPWWLLPMYGFMGVGYWYVVNRPPKIPDPLAGWEIVEESALQKQNPAGGAPTESASSVPK
jgi:predicted membrane metal-binding protein